jgi:hypothetical protein
MLAIRSYAGWPYDPWSDINDDGKMRVDDVLDVASRFGTDGDPTRNVNVTNWPKSSDVPIWWDHYLADGATATSPVQHSDGYSRLHILIRVTGLGAAETVDFTVYGHLYNATHTAYYMIDVYAHTFTYTNYYSSISIDVPSESFHFYFNAATGTICNVYLSYYLTWS